MDTQIFQTTHTENGDNTSKKLRRACDICHRMKLRCSGTNPCSRCQDAVAECVYSFAAKIGKPKGSRNKKTLQRLQRQEEHVPQTRPDQGCSNPAPGNCDSSLALDIDGLKACLDWSSFLNPVTSVENQSDFSIPDANCDTHVQASNPALLHDIQNFAATAAFNIDNTSFDFSPDFCIPGDPTESFLADNMSIVDVNLKPPLETADQAKNPQPKRSQDQTSACSCLRSQFESLCRLKGLEKSPGPVRHDTDIATSLNALAVSQDILKCERCHADPETNMLIIMAVDLVFRRLEGLVAKAPDALMELRVTLGDQEIVEQEPLSLMRKTLVTLVRDQVQQVFKSIRARISRLNSQANEVANKDVDQMDYVHD
ncbi:hypothetical protein N7457_002459 [Penicillium paradoxum]|uniref:uncharacterized protein n=1 Tax=Penicillium paradoxum TaxID=176176 RepID=UPI00254976B5|nr:uncharacterized protein N7457_002459 [Penicillium paradoxum]KAJ5787469.1 hypothetical protein N7457_002459 [Penicillium paradoxum]